MTNGNGESIKITRTSIAAIALAVPLILVGMTFGASMYRDHEQRLRHVEESAVEMRSLKDAVDRIEGKVDAVEGKIDAVRREIR